MNSAQAYLIPPAAVRYPGYALSRKAQTVAYWQPDSPDVTLRNLEKENDLWVMRGRSVRMRQWEVLGSTRAVDMSLLDDGVSWNYGRPTRLVSS